MWRAAAGLEGGEQVAAVKANGFVLERLSRDHCAELFSILGTSDATRFWRGVNTAIPPHQFWSFLTSGVADAFVVSTPQGRLVGLLELLAPEQSGFRSQLSVVSWGAPFLRARTIAAVPVAMDYWFSTTQIEVISVLITNESMRRVHRSLDRFFYREGLLRSAVKLNGNIEDVHCFSLTRAELAKVVTGTPQIRRLAPEWNCLDVPEGSPLMRPAGR